MGREAATRILDVCSGLCREEKPFSFRLAEAMLDALERERAREFERERDTSTPRLRQKR
jgi:hypothetical protein